MRLSGTGRGPEPKARTSRRRTRELAAPPAREKPGDRAPPASGPHCENLRAPGAGPSPAVGRRRRVLESQPKTLPSSAQDPTMERPEPRREGRSGRAEVRRAFVRNAPGKLDRSGMRGAGRRRSRTGRAALPFCHLHFKTPKPDGRYPVQLQRLGDHLRKRRLELGLFQKEVGTRLGADPKTVNNWEMGRSEPRLRFIPRIPAFLGYDPRPSGESFGQELRGHERPAGSRSGPWPPTSGSI